MSNSPENQKLPGQFIDALIGYAMDPLQWEAFAEALDQRGPQLRALDPSAFLATLSQAESLAWQMRGAPDQAINRSDCVFFLLNEQGQPLQSSENTDALTDYCMVNKGALVFHDDSTRTDFDHGLKGLANGAQHQVLVELRGQNPNSRYGYLVNAADLPAAINQRSEAIAYGFLVAQAESSLQTRSVLKSSFGLTSAETAVCEQLLSGLQLKAVASVLNISTNTARNHLQSVFEKTGLNRQGDLILMMTQLSVILTVIGSHASASSPNADESNYPAYQFAIVGDPANPRRVAYRSYGEGSNKVIYCHESVGSSRLLPGSATLATQLGLTVIALERPGSGFSDPLENYTFDDTAADIEALLEQLDIDKVTFLGFLSGAAHALAAAAKLKDRVNHILLIGGRGPTGFNTSDNSTIAVLRRRLTDQPWLLATFFNILRNRANAEINRNLLLRLYGSVDHDRQLFDDNPEYLEHMVAYTLESLVVSANGVVGEIRCFSNPSAIDMDAISAPISVWHGTADALAKLDALQDDLGDKITHLRTFEDCGSAIIFEYWQDILRYIAQTNI